MAARQITPQMQVEAYLDDKLQRLEKKLLYNLNYLGERCLIAARDTNSYRDRTGNLRSSIGYIVAKDGLIIESSSFQTVKQGGQGAKDGKEYARRLVNRFPKGIVLILVAGKEYAAYVSARYDVLDSAELLAEKLLPGILKKLGFLN